MYEDLIGQKFNRLTVLEVNTVEELREILKCVIKQIKDNYEAGDYIPYRCQHDFWWWEYAINKEPIKSAWDRYISEDTYQPQHEFETLYKGAF